jgi:hypothetical protein
MVHLVQISNGTSRCVGLVEEPGIRCLEGIESVYALVEASLHSGVLLSEYARAKATGDLLDYDAIYCGRSVWKLLCPVDIPDNPSRVLVAGTGLTHLGSAKERQAMHSAEREKSAPIATDSMRMFQWGVEGGRPTSGKIGVAPEWFYKGDGSILRPPFAALSVPAYAEDGGEEAELAGVYLIGKDGTPYRIGMVIGNEFSDHKFEKRNYLNLAGSKLRNCSLGPELVVGASFQSISGRVRIERQGKTLWEKKIETGEENMCHSLANLEHHHFKFEGHRQPGTLHVHFFGAHSLSFGDDVELCDGDWMEVSFEGFGRALRNPIRIESEVRSHPIVVNELA